MNNFHHTIHKLVDNFHHTNLWSELDNCLSVAQLVRALYRNRRAAGSIPPRETIVAFSAAAPAGWSNKCIKIPLEISV